MVNKVILVGRLCIDPRKGEFGADSRSFFTIACGKKEYTQFIPVVAWKKSADFANTYLKKGDTVYIEGEIKYQSGVNDSGVRVDKFNVVAMTIQSVARHKEGNYVPDANIDDVDGGNTGIPEETSEVAPF